MSATSSSFGSSPPREWQGPQTQTNRRDHGEKSSGLRFPFRGFSLPTALNTEFDTIKLRRWTELPQLCSLQGRSHPVAPLSPSVSGVPPSHTLRTTVIGTRNTAPAAVELTPRKIARLVQGKFKACSTERRRHQQQERPVPGRRLTRRWTGQSPRQRRRPKPVRSQTRHHNTQARPETDNKGHRAQGSDEPKAHHRKDLGTPENPITQIFPYNASVLVSDLDLFWRSVTGKAAKQGYCLVLGGLHGMMTPHSIDQPQHHDLLSPASCCWLIMLTR